MSGESTPASVRDAKQAGEARTRWSWTERSVWTDRMLTALEQGVKGGRWFSLIDKVHRPANLHAAFAKVKANRGAAGVDHVTIAMFEDDLDGNLTRLGESLRDGTYRPQSIRRVMIPKPGSQETRPLGIPTVRDRVAQGALRQVIEPIFERAFADHSYGFRPGRGAKDALREVDRLLGEGFCHVVDADLRSYFDTIDHDLLMAKVEEKISDGRVLDLIRLFLSQPIFEGLSEAPPTRGTPQGAVLSPLLANLYLDALDHEMAGAGYRMIRYADDFVVLCETRERADSALELIQGWVDQARLTLHPDKTRVVDARNEGFDFLGYRFENGRKRPRDKSLRRLKDTVRRKTRRTNGRSLGCVIADVNLTLRGWFGYFKHSHRHTFPVLDGWVRMRLRSLLRQRRGLRGRGRGADHQRWPNAFFAEHGLFRLEHAHAAACQSARR